MDFDKLKYDLKVMIIQECEKEDIYPEDIDDNIELFSDKCLLELDSLDALQISMGLQNRFNIRLADTKEFRNRVTTIEKLAQYVEETNG
ncbi:MAG: phosphopantetheine-binding protein [Campylobacterota bacterium]|nr:phosphopantetheine-binding protein [Campylobacterota bacterium]